MGPAIFSQITLTAAVLSIVAVTGCSSAAPPSSSSNNSHSSPQQAEVAPAAPEPAPESISEPTSEPSPETTPEPVAPAPTVIPGCEELVPVESLHFHLGEQFQHFPGEDFSQSFMASTIGPAAKAAIEQSSQSLYCSWGIPNSDGGTSVLVSELPEQARTEFLAALRSSDFIESEVSGAPAFVWQSDLRYGPRYFWYAFTDKLLVSSLALAPDGSLGKVVASSLQTSSQ